MRVETIIKFKVFILILLNFEFMRYECAVYNGTSSGDAKDYLDNSQGRKGFKRYNLAHPRNHCAVKNPDSNTPCVQNYSQGCKKSGFLTQSDQDFVAHHVLLHPRVQRELKILNQVNIKFGKSNYNIRRSITLSATEMNIPEPFMVGEWVNGVLKKVSSMQSVTIVLQHFDGQETDPNAPVHILTFFPRMSDVVEDGEELKVTEYKDFDDNEPEVYAEKRDGEFKESESNEIQKENSNRGPTTIFTGKYFTKRNLIIASVGAMAVVFCASAANMVYFKNSPKGYKFSQVPIKRISDVDDGEKLKNEESIDQNPRACAEASESNVIQSENSNQRPTVEPNANQRPTVEPNPAESSQRLTVEPNSNQRPTVKPNPAESSQRLTVEPNSNQRPTVKPNPAESSQRLTVEPNSNQRPTVKPNPAESSQRLTVEPNSNQRPTVEPNPARDEPAPFILFMPFVPTFGSGF